MPTEKSPTIFIVITCAKCTARCTFSIPVDNLDDTSIFSIFDDAIDFFRVYKYVEWGDDWFCSAHAPNK